LRVAKDVKFGLVALSKLHDCVWISVAMNVAIAPV